MNSNHWKLWVPTLKYFIWLCSVLKTRKNIIPQNHTWKNWKSMGLNMMKDILCSYSTTSWLVICNYYLPCIAYMAIHIQFLRNYFSNALEVLADNHLNLKICQYRNRRPFREYSWNCVYLIEWTIIQTKRQHSLSNIV